MKQAKITKVSGPLIIASGLDSANLHDVVYVGEAKLIGEIIELRGDSASIQVYEETSGIKVGDFVINTNAPLSIELAPGIMSGIFDGIGRPLDEIRKLVGNRITTGISVDKLDRQKLWEFKATKKIGDTVTAGDVLGVVQETTVIEHRIMVPYGIHGKITKIESGKYTIVDSVAEIDGKPVQMLQKWPVRQARPIIRKLATSVPLITGQRVIDTLFPIAKGGVAAIPGPFGSGKTVCQHQIAKWSDAQVVVYIGCGERGNEMTDVLNEFPELVDVKTGEPLMKRTILIANTSDMPVAAREASIYTGITIAEYFRDMGYDVAIMADSTSRWAEALREMSGRLEELPGEEGYPAYLSSRIAEFYERAGRVQVLGSKEQIGSITAIGAVSPPGGDLSEPVSQATLRIVKVFWGLSATLAYRRHFPAIDWLASYSLYVDQLANWYRDNLSPEYLHYRQTAIKILQLSANLEEIVRLVGEDSLSDADRLILSTANLIKENYLMQDAMNEVDTYATPRKQFLMLEAIITYYQLAETAINHGMSYEKIILPTIREEFAQFRYTPNDEAEKILDITSRIKFELGGKLHE
ncbi:MAG: V-type ATP synthase subunit A [Clostridia bacterium]|nr:V-type ATP synthase subunit A [Clostridia bacterium]